MNGRVYDYNLGRFLSVDPLIQSPTSTQSINPYSYVMNNPLAGTDPTGYCSTGTNVKGHDAAGCQVAYINSDGKDPQGKKKGPVSNGASPKSSRLTQLPKQTSDLQGQGEIAQNMGVGTGGSANSIIPVHNLTTGDIWQSFFSGVGNNVANMGVDALNLVLNFTDLAGIVDPIEPVQPFTPVSNYFGSEGAAATDGVIAVTGARALAEGVVGLTEKGVAKVAGMRGAKGVIRSLDDVGSLRGAKLSEVERIADKKYLDMGWTKKPLKDGNGIRYFDGKGNSFQINRGYDGGKDMHGGPYIKLTQGNEKVRIPLHGNPDL